MLITLTTDFGHGSAYVAAMKGALLSVARQAQIIDLSHEIPPQDTLAAALFLRDVLPYFPPAIHVVVVDPGVGTERALLLVERDDVRILAPDNGCWTAAIPKPTAVWKLNQPRYWRPDVSATFHGRDILAPIAGHLVNGVLPADMAELVHDWRTIEVPKVIFRGDAAIGEVMSVDRFGNLITNIPAQLLADDSLVEVGGRSLGQPVRTYSDRPNGALFALVSSSGFLEIAVSQGSAAKILGVGIGAAVEVRPALVSHPYSPKTI